MRILLSLSILLISVSLFGQTIVGDYPFNGNANDISGSGNNGIVTGATLTCDRFGNPNSAYEFNGTTDYIGLGNDVFLGDYTTITAWIYLDRDDIDEAIFSSHVDNTGGNGLKLVVKSNASSNPNNLQLTFDKRDCMTTTDIGIKVTNDSLETGIWSFVALTVGPDSTYLYINGVKKSTEIEGEPGLADSQWTNDLCSGIHATYIGRFKRNVSDDYFDGKLDDIKIYSDNLSSAQIDSIYQAEKSPLAPCLIAKYEFSGNADDLSGNCNNGTVYGATLTCDRFGKADSAYYFNGAGDYIEITNALLPSTKTSYTLTSWIKPQDVSTGLTVFSDRYGASYSYKYRQSVEIADSTIQTNYFDGSTSCTANSGIKVDFNKWYFVTSVFDAGTDELSIYVNGQFLASSNNPVVWNAANNPTNIGRFTGPTTGNYFKGSIDDIKLFNCPKTAQQIDSIYQAEKSPLNPCLVAKYDFNGNADDLSGNCNNGIVNGATLTCDRYGRADSAYYFDGVDDYISTSSNIEIASGDFSATFWARRAEESSGIGNTLMGLGTAATNNGLQVILGDNGYFIVDFYGPNVNTTTTANATQWHQYSLTYETGTTTLSLYKDGQVVASNTTSTDFLGSGVAFFGRTAWPGNYFHGAMDDIKIYNCGLTAQQIDSIYQAEKSPLNPCLVAKYDFNGNADDLSGNCNNGTVYGATLVNDRYGNPNSAYSFDGVDDHISLNTTIGDFGTGDFTISSWAMKSDTTIPGGAIFGKRNSTADGNMLLLHSNPGYELSSGTGDYMGAGITYQVKDTWYKVTLVRQGLNVKLYLNGQVIDEQTASGLQNINNGVMAEIGARYQGASIWNLWNGAIDEVRLYNCALDSATIAECWKEECVPFYDTTSTSICSGDSIQFGGMYYSTAGQYNDTLLAVNGCDSISTLDLSIINGTACTSGLCVVADYPFTGNANDVSGLGNDGVVNGATLTGDRYGNSNSAYSFDGVNNNINVGDVSILDGNMEATWSWWMASSDSLPRASGNDYVSVIRKNDSWVPLQFANDAYDYNRSLIFTSPGSAGVNHIWSTGDIPYINEWTSFTLVKEASELKLYRNGVQISVSSYSGALPNSVNDLVFGSTSSGTEAYNGLLDDIKIYGCSLDSAQIDSIWKSECVPFYDTTSTSICSGDSVQFGGMYYSTTGQYNDTLVAVNGCDSISTLDLSINNGPTSLATSITDPSCNGDSDGSVTILNINGGTAPYTYNWSNGSTTNGITNTLASTYNVTVTDANGCVTEEVYTLTDPALMTTGLSIVPSVCGQMNGSANVSVTNGSGPYVYNWATGETIATVTGLGSGNIDVTVTDVNGCVSSSNGIVTDSGSSVSVTGTASICSGDSMLLEGSYQTVAGTYYDTLQTTLGCDSIVETVLSLSQTNSNVISGVVYFEGTPITSGEVRLIRKDGNSPQTMYDVDSMMVNGDGSYLFDSIAPANYMVKALGDTSMYDNVATYADSTNHWQHATQYDLSNNCMDTTTGINVYLIDFPTNVGFGNINGRITRGGPGKNNLSQAGDPIPGIDISLEQIPGGIVKGNDVTDGNGDFEFDGVPVGDYRLHSDILGYSMDTVHVAQFDGSGRSYEINLCVNEDSLTIDVCHLEIVSVTNITTNELNLSIYPNPTEQGITISFNNDSQEEVNILITDIQGKQVLTQKTTSSSLTINDLGIGSGTYLIEVVKGTGVLKGKFMVK